MRFTCERCGYQTNHLRTFNEHKNRKVKCPLPRKGDLKYCVKCENYCHVSEFNLRKDSPDGLRNECKACKQKYSLQYNLDNKEQIDEGQARYRAQNKTERRRMKVPSVGMQTTRNIEKNMYTTIGGKTKLNWRRITRIVESGFAASMVRTRINALHVNTMSARETFVKSVWTNS